MGTEVSEKVTYVESRQAGSHAQRLAVRIGGGGGVGSSRWCYRTNTNCSNRSDFCFVVLFVITFTIQIGHKQGDCTTIDCNGYNYIHLYFRFRLTFLYTFKMVKLLLH